MTTTRTCRWCFAELDETTSACPSCGASAPGRVQQLDGTVPGARPLAGPERSGTGPESRPTAADASATPVQGSPFFQRHRAPVPLSLASRFQGLGILGWGGGGTVHRVMDLRLGREVALKVLETFDPGCAEAFEAEARILAGLENDYVVRLYDAGVADGHPFLVMELIRGPTLSQRLAQGRPTQLEAIRIAADILRAVQAAHSRGIVHRDLKPSNVFLDDTGRAKVADFGLALMAGKDAVQTDAPPGAEGTTEPVLAGTPGYMAPEQIRGQPVGPATDIYATGVILHEMLTGRRLFAGDSVMGILKVQRQSVVPAPSRVNASVPRALDELVMRALTASAAARPTAAELLASLVDWLEKASRGRRPAPSTSYPARPYRPLEPFEASDAALFLGRDAEVHELVSHLESPSTRVLALFGPCGIGKSSLLRAGLFPALDPERFHGLVLNSGPDPLQALWDLLWAQARKPAEAAEAADPPAGGSPTDRLLGTTEPSDPGVRPQPRILPELVLRLRLPPGRTLLLAIDQLEELITHNPRGSPAIGGFFEAIQCLAESHRLSVKVVLSFRREYRGEFFPLEERLGSLYRSFPVHEIGEAGLIEAIEGPTRAQVYGFRFDEGLPGRLAADILRVTRASGDTALPVAQIVCSQLVARMKSTGASSIGPTLYEGSWGGAEGALRRYVEERLSSAGYTQHGAMARQMLKALTVREPGGERFSHRCDEEELLSFPD
ncbi:MAG: serine/threonine-protein kinase PknK, partial [Candidatus Riflebacteria bacterium]|nr:serine/threonine-protein kinase PknK [Candidatus Riflebacteria bacterium]